MINNSPLNYVPSGLSNTLFDINHYKGDVETYAKLSRDTKLPLATLSNRIHLDTDIVDLVCFDNDVVCITMKDKNNKNAFTDALADGLGEAFEHINANTTYKVVILTGYDNYFACGGSKDGLLAIQKGDMKFTDSNIYSLALECDIPVIACMQGHAIGAGWSMGMFCDFSVFSKESVYVSNYMKYGFTPGAGATLIFPYRFGIDYAREILFTAKEYKGEDLSERGIAMPVVPRSQIFDYSIQLAGTIARSNSRSELVLWKQHFCRELRGQLQDTLHREVNMHEKTFVGNKEVLTNILTQYAVPDQENNADYHPNKSISKEIESGRLTDIVNVLRDSIAHELYLEISEVDNDTQFIDMGMDSVTGVTWVRKVSEILGITLTATKIYDYPTITSFANYLNQLPGSNISLTQTQQVTIEADETISTDSGQSLSNILRSSLADELYLDVSDIDDNIQFIDFGLDSVTGVTWIRKLNETLGLSISATKIYDYPTISAMKKYIAELTDLTKLSVRHGSANNDYPDISNQIKTNSNDLPSTNSTQAKSQETGNSGVRDISTPIANRDISTKLDSSDFRKPRLSDTPEPIAVIGQSGQFPGAKDVDEFWKNIKQGKDCITEIPKHRWDMNAFYDTDPSAPAKSYCKHMGVVQNIDKFDPLFFNISPAEAKYMEPQQRLFLENCWSSIEDAAINPAELSGSRCGVFVGCGISDYGQGITAQDLMGSAASILSSRISYLLNLKGPSIAIDTSCSSSLVAIAEACNSLILGISDLAIAGGVCVLTGPGMHIMASKAGMLSKDGRCFTFDSRANGFVPGEGVGVLLLKRLSDAIYDGDPIHGVIRGWGVNQDGKTNGITAPSVNSQISLEKEVYKRFKIDPGTISLVEAHGTGTKLGDPIEIEALTASFRSYTDKSNYCALGSVKSNIGHLMPAAGVSGVIKVLMAIKNKKLPPAVNYQQPNEHLTLQDSPFYVNTDLRPWELDAGSTRRAAVSSFGFSGTNAHLVIEEYRVETSAVENNFPTIFPFSAKNKQQLKLLLRNMHDYLVNATDLSINDLAHTLQMGREAMDCRVTIIASNLPDLQQKLGIYVKDGNGGKDSFVLIKRDSEKLDLFDTDEDVTILLHSWVKKRKLQKIAQLWLNGVTVDWTILFKDLKPSRIHIPTYPFADGRYWLDTQNSSSKSKTKIQKCDAQSNSSNVLSGPEQLSFLNNSNFSILSGLMKIVARITEIPVNGIDIDADYEALGLDSILITSISKELKIWLGQFDSTLFFKYKTLSALAEYMTLIYSEIKNPSYFDNTVTPPIPNPNTGAVSFHNKRYSGQNGRLSDELANHEDRIAVIGMNGQYPNAKNLQEFWQNLCDVKDSIREIPIERFDFRPYFNPTKGKDDTIYAKWGGFLDCIDKFDALFFNVSPQDARLMDPHERLFLESSWECLESAGYIHPHWQTESRNIGVFAGATFNNYQLLAADAFGKEFLAPVDSQIFSIANHVSYYFNFSGPSLTLDTACSSSLYAIHLACESLIRGECEVALAGGVNLTLHPSKYFTICSRGFAASDGRCHAFAEGGDGYVPSEAVGTVLLKSYKQALVDNDNILAVIRGTGVSHDGKTKNYSVPNPVAQTKAIEAALLQSSINPETISYVEAHGTGTALGDPIEIMGLTDAYSKYTDKKQFCAIGSVKSNIGHGEASAGIAQFSKTVLQMQHKTIVPTLMHGDPNPNIDFKNSAFVVQERLTSWEKPLIDDVITPRRAGISSFGAGGVNVHIIIEENEKCPQLSDTSRTGTSDQTFVIPFSVHVESLIPTLITNFITWLEDAQNLPRLVDIAYTLQTKRAEFRYRLVFVSDSSHNLLSQLKEYLKQKSDQQSRKIYIEGDSKNKKTAEQLSIILEDGHLELGDSADQMDKFVIARDWVVGIDIDWMSQFDDQINAKCLYLPSYPFLKKRYWITDGIGKQTNAVTSLSNNTTQAPTDNRCTTTSKNTEDRIATNILPGFFSELLDLSDFDRDEKLKTLLEVEIKAVMGFDSADNIDYEQGFFELGMESMQALKLKQELEQKLEIELTDTTLFDYPTINSLSEHILGGVSWDSLLNTAGKSRSTVESKVDSKTIGFDKTYEHCINEYDDIDAQVADMEDDALIVELMYELNQNLD